MPLLAVGINHKTAPVEIREKVAFEPARVPEALLDLKAHTDASEAAIVSTCNRTEVVCCVENATGDNIIDWFRHYHQLMPEEVNPYVYIHPERFAVQHLMRVASGLDSLVLGEPQILGQLKDAYSTARNAGTVGILLNRLFQHTFSVAKQVRTDTAIGASPVSVAFAAVNLAKQIFGEFAAHTAMMIGAGETIELAARHLHENGIGRLIIANRTVERAHTLAAEFKGYAIALSEIPTHLADADIVISSTASSLPILGKGAVESAIRIRKHKPMLMVDIAVPRDIEPEVADMDDVYLYTVDDLREIIDENIRSRQEAAQQAEEIIDTQVAHFMSWLQSLHAVSTIRAYRRWAEQTRDDEIRKALQLLERGESPEAVLQEFARLMTNKLIHVPTTRFRRAGMEGNDDLLEMARRLFGLNDSDI